MRGQLAAWGLPSIWGVPSLSGVAFLSEDLLYSYLCMQVSVFRTEFIPGHVQLLATFLTLPVNLQ